ncbi:uncharacterized protein LOC144640677 [Oculina patagonica]
MPRQHLPTWRRYLTVEPVLLFYAFGLMTSMPIWDQYVYRRVSERMGFPYAELVVDKEGLGCNFTGPNSTLKELEKRFLVLCVWHYHTFSLSGCMFNNVYRSTLGNTFNGFVFLLCAALKIIPLCLLWCIKVPPVTDSNQEKGEELQLEGEEKNANQKQEEELIKRENNREEIEEEMPNRHQNPWMSSQKNRARQDN